MLCSHGKGTRRKTETGEEIERTDISLVSRDSLLEELLAFEDGDGDEDDKREEEAGFWRLLRIEEGRFCLRYSELASKSTVGNSEGESSAGIAIRY